MTIYFVTNNTKKNEIKIISNIINRQGHKVITQVIGNKDKNEIDLPQKFDVLIADIQEISVGINYQIVLALTEKKPVLCIFPEGANISKSLPYTKGNIARNLVLRLYNKHSLPGIIEGFLDNVENESGQSERFNFFITSDLREYINWISFSGLVTRSGFIRQLIRDQMQKDDNYKTFAKKKK